MATMAPSLGTLAARERVNSTAATAPRDNQPPTVLPVESRRPFKPAPFRLTVRFNKTDNMVRIPVEIHHRRSPVETRNAGGKGARNPPKPSNFQHRETAAGRRSYHEFGTDDVLSRFSLKISLTPLLPPRLASTSLRYEISTRFATRHAEFDLTIYSRRLSSRPPARSSWT
jgi:hypothetical protein